MGKARPKDGRASTGDRVDTTTRQRAGPVAHPGRRRRWPRRDGPAMNSGKAAAAPWADTGPTTPGVDPPRDAEPFRSLFESAAVGIEQVAADGRFLRVNRALCRILGYEPGELLGRTDLEITHPDD